MSILNLRSYAHLGDALWEVIIRKEVIYKTIGKSIELHKNTVKYVNAGCQTELLEYLKPSLKEEELELVRQARNIKISSARKVNQSLHRQATAFEALLGYLYINDVDRYNSLKEKLIDRCFNNQDSLNKEEKS